MPTRKDGWPAETKEQYMDAQKRYILLTSHVFEREWGAEWYTLRTAKAHSTVDLSGERFYLESLTGAPEMGLLHPGIHRDHITVLNVSKNQLTDISCLNHKTDGAGHDFRNLHTLNASRNMLTDVRLELGNLAMLNLAHNELVTLPSFAALRELQKLILSHNRIDGTLREFEQRRNSKLWYLDLSSNQFSWRPSVFRDQLDVLEQCHIRELKLWPNPFAEHFKEYQFLTVTALDSLVSLDGFTIDHDLRAELRIEADNLRAKGVDYTIFDIKVEEKRRSGALVDDSNADITGSNVPRIQELIGMLDLILDHPEQLSRHVTDFEERVNGLWGAHFHDRQQLLMVTSEERELGVPATRPMTPEEEKQAVAEFIDKMQQVLERDESVQDVLVMCIVRLLACGNALLGQRCARLLAEWIDASTVVLQGRIQEVSLALFKDLRSRALAGMQSMTESPFECYEAAHGRRGDITVNLGRCEAIAECAYIMGALTHFGSPAVHTRVGSPLRSLILGPFLPALCREPHRVRGPDLPSDEWAVYRGFDAFPEETAEMMDIEDSNLLVCQERCARLGYGGFVTEESQDQPGLLRAIFKAQMPDALVGMRRVHSGRALHVRPSKAAKMLRRPFDNGEETYETWTVWVNSLAVLVVATADKYNAAHCISAYGIHRAIVKHDSQPSTGFTEAWMLVTQEASRAFVLMLQVAQNLTRAAKPDGQEATKYFMEHKLHINCWDRARRRLMENGAAIPQARLNESSPDFTVLISALVSVVCAMTQAGPLEVADAVMDDLRTKGLDVFDLLLEVAAYAGMPDPVLLAASLEAIYIFLDSNVTRPRVLAKVLNRLHDSAILLPYIKGPKVRDVNNLQYQDLWRICMVRYPPESSAQDHMPELFDEDAYAATATSGRQVERAKWRSRVPELRDLQHPLMHRVLLAIVRLIKLFSVKAQNDPTGLLKNVTSLLDDQGRERLLIGPATGLVSCLDFDVKIECLECVEHVLLTSPLQLSAEEMGWILQYLGSAGLGMGKQEEFLMEVLKLLVLFIRDETKTGATFRQKFAKLAIRESFEMLRVNCLRDVQGRPAEEASKMDMSLGIIQLLQVCSRPLSGGMRKFLRRVDFLNCFKEVMQQEDTNDQKGIRVPLLSTWTGRNMREVLLPMFCGSILRPRGRTKYRTLVRLADVLQGRSDYRPDNKFSEIPPTNEQHFWPSVSMMHMVELDQVEVEDWTVQQEQFISSDGINGLLKVAERYLQGSQTESYMTKAQAMVDGFVNSAREKVKMWWDSCPPFLQKNPWADGTKPLDAPLSPVEECFMTRLRNINQRVSELYGYSLDGYDEKRGSSLVKLAKDLAKHFEENQKMHRKQYEEHFKAYKALLNRSDEYLVGNSRMTIVAAMEKGLRVEKPRQPHGDLKRLLDQASMAHLELKSLLIAKYPYNDKDVDEWARTPLDKGKDDIFNREVGPKGLVSFLSKHGARVFDPGVEQHPAIMRKHRFKYFNDNTRIRNASRLIIGFPDISELNKSFKEIVQTSLLSIAKVRNRFARPSNFARRSIILNVEIQLTESKHLCELELLVSDDTFSKQRTLTRPNQLLETLEKSLRDGCQVKADAAEHVAEYLCNELESRSIRHGDTIILKCLDKYLEVQKEDVFAQSDAFSTSQIFVVEREAGIGVVKSGDIISLRSKATGSYLDITSNGQVRCRFGDVLTQRSNLRFIMDIDILEKPCTHTGGVGSLAGWFGTDTTMSSEGRARGGAQAVHASNLHTQNRVRLRAKGSPRYVTVMPGATYLLSSQKQRVKGQPLEDRLVENQLLTVYREGSLAEHLALDPTSESDGPRGMVGNTEEERQEQVLLEAHMCTSLPMQDSCPREGGVFRRAPPAFKVVARRQAEREDLPGTQSSDDVSGLETEFSRMPLLLSAIIRCIYVLIERPRSNTAWSYALDEVLGGTTGSATRMLALVVAVQLACYKHDSFEEHPDVISAWMPAKLLRLFSAALGHAPVLSMPARQLAENGNGGRSRDRRHEEQGEHDQQRMILLGILTQYMSSMLVEPILSRLSIVAHRSLSLQEVVLLREFATTVERMVFNFFSNELRGIKQQQAPSTQEQATLDFPPNLESGAGGTPVANQALVKPPPSEKHASWLGKKHAHRIPRESQAQMLAELVPSATARVLVHAMLYGVHQEAIAFTSGFSGSDLTIRLISSLVNRSIGALAAVMHGRSGREDTTCDYHVCEAISQAMSNGAQLVPRARITQLMQERATDQLRGTLEAMLDEGLFDPSPLNGNGPSPARPRPTERILALAYAWAGPVDGHAYLALPRRLVAVTSRLNLAVVALPPQPADAADAGPPPPREALSVVSFRDLHRLQRLVVHPKMRQLVGLWWQWDESEAQQRELLIFESSGRRRAFQQALRKVDCGRAVATLSPTRELRQGVPEVQVRPEVVDSLQEACKVDGRNNTTLVNVTFVRSHNQDRGSSWSGSYDHEQVEVFALTVDTLAVLTLASFLRHFARNDDSQYYASAETPQTCVLETDSEDEDDGTSWQVPRKASESNMKWNALYQSPWQLKHLQGVWFLAEAEPKVKLQFERPQQITFASDGERQRWRRHLACVLGHQEKRQEDGQGRGRQGWSVVPTGKTELGDVKQYAMSTGGRAAHGVLTKEQPRALADAAKAAG